MTDYLEHVLAFGSGELAETMGIEITEASPERLVASMPVAGNRQPYRPAARRRERRARRVARLVGCRPARRTGAHRGRHRDLRHAPPQRHERARHRLRRRRISLGRTLATYEIVVVDDEGRRMCTSRLTCLLRDRPSV